MVEPREPIHFVTGRLAAEPLRAVLDELAPRAGFTYTLDVLPISVAALMTPAWAARHVRVPESARSVLIPGWCDGDLAPLQRVAGVTVRRGPKDLRQLPRFFGQSQVERREYGEHRIEILAEINHAPSKPLERVVATARQLAADGADVIDIGCIPGMPWHGVGECVRRLRDEGLRVSIDSFDAGEVAHAVAAGAELVLSVQTDHLHAAVDWGCEVVVIPNDISTLAGLDESVEFLATAGVPFRIDPVLEPIGLGFAASLRRYMDVRTRFPDQSMLMGIGNLTEMTDADSAAINLLLLAICAELGIGSVLTTQVIPWAQSSVRECDLARRLVHYAIRHHVPAKRVDSSLVMLRDDRLTPFGIEQLQQMARQVKDRNFRLFAENGNIHVLNSEMFLAAADPFELFDQLRRHARQPIDSAHAFYLGHEMARARIALLLGKQYQQDQPLDWGFLSAQEQSTRDREDDDGNDRL